MTRHTLRFSLVLTFTFAAFLFLGAYIPCASAADTAVDQTDDNPDAKEGDVVGDEIFQAGMLTPAGSLAEQTNIAEAMDCGELADGYKYQEARNEVRCEREDAKNNPQSCEYRCYKVRNAGCFAPETRILLGDSLSSKPIDQLRRGDWIWNPELNKAVRVAMIVRGPETKPMIEIGFGANLVRVTETHPMIVQQALTSSGFKPVSLTSSEFHSNAVRVKKANEITTSDKLLGKGGTFEQVSTVRILPVDPKQEVYNLELELDTMQLKDHLIVANGVVTGDYLVQQQLSR
jgi:hypothetical protein